jgi:hypothetical protein
MVGWKGRATAWASDQCELSLFKTEIIWRRGPWRSIAAIVFATLEWVDRFNHRRLLVPIGDIPRAECEQASYRQQGPHAMAA